MMVARIRYSNGVRKKTVKENKNNIPQIFQTLISLRNLSRHDSGPLKKCGSVVYF